jgi:sugar lactone lactonase YvrE
MKTSLIVSAVAVLAAVLFPISGLGAPGDLYVGSAGDSTIVKFAQDGTKTTFGSGVTSPRALAFDGSGNLFEADFGSNKIFKFRPDGTKTIFASGLDGVASLAFDSSGNLFAVVNGPGTIVKFTPDGTKTTFASGLSSPTDLAIDRAGNLFVGSFSGTTIFKFTPAGTQSTFASGLNQPLGLATDSLGNLFVADKGSNTILKYTPAGTKTIFASGLSNPFSLAFDSAGNLFAVDASDIYIFTPDKFPFATGVSGTLGLTFEPTRHQFLNVSTRALVGTGDNALIGGFIMNGNGQVDEAVVVRALGPSLTAFGVPGALQDPTLELRSADGTLVATNDNWKTRPDGSSQQALIESTGVAPSDNRESAIYARLPAGRYTPIVRGIGGTGVAIVEVYNLQ